MPGWACSVRVLAGPCRRLGIEVWQLALHHRLQHLGQLLLGATAARAAQAQQLSAALDVRLQLLAGLGGRKELRSRAAQLLLQGRAGRQAGRRAGCGW